MASTRGMFERGPTLTSCGSRPHAPYDEQVMQSAVTRNERASAGAFGRKPLASDFIAYDWALHG